MKSLQKVAVAVAVAISLTTAAFAGDLQGGGGGPVVVEESEVKVTIDSTPLDKLNALKKHQRIEQWTDDDGVVVKQVIDTDGLITEVTGGAAYKSGDTAFVSATGWVPTLGWTNIDLAIRWVNWLPPADGILDLFFIGTASTETVPQVITPVGASYETESANWLKGFRIHAAKNTIVVMLDDEKEDPVVAIDGDYWPFPLAQKVSGGNYYAICSHHSHGTTGWTSPLSVKKYALAAVRHHNKANKGHSASLSN